MIACNGLSEGAPIVDADAADAYPRRHVTVTCHHHVTIPNGLFDPHVTVSDGFFDQPSRHHPLGGLFDRHVTVPDTLSPNHRVTIRLAVFSATTSPSRDGLFPPCHRSRDGLPATSPSRDGLFDRHVTAAAPPLVEGCGQMAYGYFTAIDHCHVTHRRVRRKIGSGWGCRGKGKKRGKWNGEGIRRGREAGVRAPPSFLQQSPPPLWGGIFRLNGGA